LCFEWFRGLTGGRQVRAGSAVQDVVFFLVRLADAEVDNGPVGAGFSVFGGPGWGFRVVSTRHFDGSSLMDGAWPHWKTHFDTTLVPSALLPPSRFK
jgi:hypothetical protein